MGRATEHPLATTVDGTQHLIGIAIVTVEGDDIFWSNQSGLVSGLARYLLDTGAHRAVSAA